MRVKRGKIVERLKIMAIIKVMEKKQGRETERYLYNEPEDLVCYAWGKSVKSKKRKSVKRKSVKAVSEPMGNTNVMEIITNGIIIEIINLALD